MKMKNFKGLFHFKLNANTYIVLLLMVSMTDDEQMARFGNFLENQNVD